MYYLMCDVRNWRLPVVAKFVFEVSKQDTRKLIRTLSTHYRTINAKIHTRIMSTDNSARGEQNKEKRKKYEL